MKKVFLFCLISFIQNSMAMDFIFIDSSQREIIENDLENLCSLNYNSRGRREDNLVEWKRLFETTFGLKFNCIELRNFLETHIKVIIKDLPKESDLIFFEFAEDNRANIKLRKIIDQGILPSFYQFFQRDVDILMAHNIGRTIHLNLQKPGLQRIFSQLEISYQAPEIVPYIQYNVGNERKVIPVLPTTGIIHLTDNFFLPPQTFGNSIDSNSMAGSLYRLATLFHEASHSIGPEFDHVECSADISLERRPGRYDCDDTLAGAHGFKALFLAIATPICDRCSVEEKRNLMALAVESTGLINDRR